MTNDKQPTTPDNSGTLLPKRHTWKTTTHYPKSTPERTKLIESILADTLATVPIAEAETDRGRLQVEVYRQNLTLMSSDKLRYLRYSSDPDSKMDEASIRKAVRNRRSSHNLNFDRFYHDGIFVFFYNILRKYGIESKIELRTLEGIYFAVSRHNRAGKPVIDEAFRDMAKIVVAHTNYAKGGPMIVQNFPGQIVESKDGGEEVKAKQWQELDAFFKKHPEVRKVMEKTVAEANVPVIGDDELKEQLND